MLTEIFPGAIQLGGPNSGLLMECGRAAFSGIYTDTTSMPIRTSLTEVLAGFAQVYDTHSPATDATMTAYSLFVDLAVSSGAVSVYRSSQAAINGLTFNYMLIGRKYATS